MGIATTGSCKGRRSKGTGTLKELPNGHWKARRPEALGGEYKTFATKKAADDWLASAKGLKQKSVTFEAYAEDWLAFQRTRVSQGGLAVATLKGYSTQVRHLKDRLGKRAIASILPQDIEGALILPDDSEIKANRNAFIRSGGRGRFRPIGRQTLVKMRAVASSLFKRAKRDGFVTSNPVAGAQRISSRKVHTDVTEEAIRPTYTAEEFDRIVATAKKMGSAYVLLGIFLGARPSEMRALRWSDINFDDGIVEISGTIARGIVGGEEVRMRPKTEASYRKVQVVPEALQLVKEAHDSYAAQPDHFVFATQNGNPIEG